MTDAKTCPTCGARLPSDATGGACPKCLLQAGFATGTGGSSAAGAHVPTPEELAPRFPGLEIGALLGRGGMGVVYRARHKALDRDVALKVLPSNVAADRAFADRFQREARALAKLQHPNIVAVHDFGESDGLFWLVMEYVDGANIRQAMKAGTIGPKEALAIVPQICDALQFAHEHGVVHRDIKPENVLLDKSGRVKVADFGLAKMMEHGETDRTLTGAGQVMGTPHYMAPEQWERPKDVDHRADIYSLGVVFYEMLTGELPIGRFAAPSTKADIDARIDEIVLRTLEKEREARYQHADDVKTDVGRVTAAAAAAAAAGAGGADPAPRIEAAVNDLLGSVAQVVEGASERVAEKGAVREAHRRHRWVFDSAAEKARGGRLSKLAVYGAMGLPAAIAMVIVFAFLTSRPGSFIRAREAAIVLGLLIVPAWIASIVAWVRIHHSNGRLRGRAWAAVGTFLPPFAFCLAAPLTLFMANAPPRVQMSWDAGPPESFPAPREGEFRGEDELGNALGVSAKERALIAGKWRRLQDFPPDRSFESTLRLYPREQRDSLEAMPEAARAERARAGELGLPLLPADRLPVPLSQFRLDVVRFTSHPDGTVDAVATASAGRSVIRFPMRRYLEEGPKWDFGLGRVDIE